MRKRADNYIFSDKIEYLRKRGMARKRTQDLATFSVTPNEQHNGWAPWKLISEFPKIMEDLLLTPRKIPPENFESKFFDKVYR